ncbi:cysteine-rich receptor-like protein kinase 3 [Macadamia integrifolia]|uniref:cysteine-rich receptor-like protein kinase 3 n=1 Tax=Macadamia integrifolia TaxID=60698 RepID=UPI001C4FE1E1|nr:cysteine-rich receptor-like protein kinase 3 [Macadamia integrifolia]
MGITENGRVAFVVFIVSCFWGISLADSQTSIVGLYCDTTNAASGAFFADYFIPAMDSLSSLVNQNGFGTTVVGEGPNAVYALAQCFKDLSSVDCELCFSVIRSILPKCYPKIGGRIFLEGCFGRYEIFSFFNEAMDSGDSKVCSYSMNSSLPDKFKEIVNEAVGNVSTEAIKNQGFAVGSVSNSNISVFSLAQCWESLDNQKCNSCLQAAASFVNSCSPALEGQSFNAGCYLRYSTGMFWNSLPTTSNSSGNHNTLWIIIGSVGGVALLLS